MRPLPLPRKISAAPHELRIPFVKDERGYVRITMNKFRHQFKSVTMIDDQKAVSFFVCTTTNFHR